MNLVLVRDDELVDATRATLRGARARHLIDVLACKPGDSVRIGRPDGPTGHGTVLEVTAHSVTLDLRLDQAPPPRPDVDLILALPRPKVLGRVLEHVAALGVRRILLLNSWRVDKSYFQTRILEPDQLRDHLFAGLEMARDTWVPTVEIRKLFKPFVEDELKAWSEGCDRVLLHPVDAAPLMDSIWTPDAPVIVAIGPEGGWTPYEVDMILDRKFVAAHIGPRILRVETACTATFAQLSLLRSRSADSSARPE